MNQPECQPELALVNETLIEAFPEEVKKECRQLIAQLLREVLRAEKEQRDEQ